MLPQTFSKIYQHAAYATMLLASTTLLGTFLTPIKPVLATAALECTVPGEDGVTLTNQASYTYTDASTNDSTDASEEELTNSFQSFSNTVKNTVFIKDTVVQLVSQGITDSNGNKVIGLGLIADGLTQELSTLGLTQAEIAVATKAAIEKLTTLSETATTAETIAQVKGAIAESVPNQANVINSASTVPLALVLMGLVPTALETMGLTAAEIEAISETATTTVTNTATEISFSDTTNQTFAAAKTAATNNANLLTQLETGLKTELTNIRRGVPPQLQSNQELNYHFQMTNEGTVSAEVVIPELYQFQQTALNGSGSITHIRYQVIDATKTVKVEGISQQSPTPITLKPQEQLHLIATVKLGKLTETTSTRLGFRTGCGENTVERTATVLFVPPINKLVDPFGRIVGCRGEILRNYEGFSVALYEADPNSPTGEVRAVLPLTETELPDNPNNDIPKGVTPNTKNSNPFFLTNLDEGKYSFLLDEKQGQLNPGRNYILVITPAEGSNYDERRLRLTIGETNGDVTRYTATSLDGKPITVNDPLQQTTVEGEIVTVEDGNRVGLTLAVLDLETSVCQAQEVRIDKTADRIAAEPGDTVIYRLSIRNLSVDPLSDLVITDTLPVGFRFLEDSVRSESQQTQLSVVTTSSDRTITFRPQATIASGQVLNIAYAAQLTPDALRGSGRNSAIVNGQLPGRTAKDGPALHQLELRPGIVADCGTIIGRVFVDKNFDGEQQKGEPGVPNAVIFLEDGNRITTDPNGLFSVANVLPGYHTGILDLTSIPGYAIAPNHYFIERNSESRLVNLAPGGMVRMNFAVIPTFQEEPK